MVNLLRRDDFAGGADRDGSANVRQSHLDDLFQTSDAQVEVALTLARSVVLA
jgi:hypothetical protein